MARQREEEERRKEVSSRFQTTITDIQTQMEAHSKRNDKLQEDNKELSQKLHTLLEQYEKREEVSVSSTIVVYQDSAVIRVIVLYDGEVIGCFFPFASHLLVCMSSTSIDPNTITATSLSGRAER